MSITIHLIKRSYSNENYEEILNNINIQRNATIQTLIDKLPNILSSTYIYYTSRNSSTIIVPGTNVSLNKVLSSNDYIFAYER